eukprot:11737405-Prorocentrum_lima.AAC.1
MKEKLQSLTQDVLNREPVDVWSARRRGTVGFVRVHTAAEAETLVRALRRRDTMVENMVLW